MDEAAAYFTRAGTARDEVGDDAGTILHTYGQAVLAAARGDHTTAQTLFVRAHGGFQRLGVAAPTCLALAGIAAADEHLGNTRAALDGYQRLLRQAESCGEMGLAALEGLARGALTNREPARAAELLNRATAIRDTYDRPAVPSEAAAAAATTAAVDRALAETANPPRETDHPVNR